MASYNVHWSHDKRGRAFDGLEVIKELDADLLVMQESWLPSGGGGDAERAAELGYEVSHAVMGHGRVGGPHKPRLVRAARSEGLVGVSMLSRLPVLSCETLDMVHLPMDTAPKRVSIRIRVDVDGSPFTYVGTHLDHLTHGSPWQLRRLARDLPTAGEPGALAGDMNMWGPVISALLPGWRRAVRGRTWPNGRPHSQIDHIMVNAPVGIEAGRVLQAGRSDHLPVRAVLSF